MEEIKQNKKNSSLESTFPPKSSSSSSSLIIEMCSSSSSTLTLIPSLPNDLSALILAFIPFPHHSRLKSVSKSWNLFISSKTFISLRNTHIPISHLSHLICFFPKDPSISPPLLFHPQTLAWRTLPLMPCNPHVYDLCNFTAVTVDTHLYVLGGSLFDTRSFPMDRPSPSRSAFRYDVLDSSLKSSSWNVIAPMLSPRGSFACVAVPDSGRILVAGGGSRHTMFGAAGSRLCSAEMYDIERDEWIALDHLPRLRAGCMGVLIRKGEDKEFWVMGGYGESRTVADVFPFDEFYKDAVVMKLKEGAKWTQVEDMWEEGERTRLGKIVVVDDCDKGCPSIFMLDGCDIFRYDEALNCWKKETSVPKRAHKDASFGFIVVGRELYIIAQLSGVAVAVDKSETRKPRQHRSTCMIIQIYDPLKKTWRSFLTKPPCSSPVDFSTAVLCTIRV